MSRRVCVVTGSRAEYGLLFWLMKEIEAHSELELQVIATGMHLSPEFGLTVQEIEKDGVIGAISGRALYDGRIDLKEAVEVLSRA